MVTCSGLKIEVFKDLKLVASPWDETVPLFKANAEIGPSYGREAASKMSGVKGIGHNIGEVFTILALEASCKFWCSGVYLHQKISVLYMSFCNYMVCSYCITCLYELVYFFPVISFGKCS